MADAISAAEALVRRLEVTVIRQEKVLADTKAQLEAARKMAEAARKSPK